MRSLRSLPRIPRHNDVNRNLHHRADHRVGNAGVSRTGIEHGTTTLEFTRQHRFEEHPADRPILQAATRIGEFGLRKNPDARELFAETKDLHHPGVPYKTQSRIALVKLQVSLFCRNRCRTSS